MVDGKGDAARLSPPPSRSPADDANYKLGTPYEVAGESYRPADAVDYDEVGLASWYGDELAGQPTANGESFNPRGISAAHPTLPMPSYAEITHLDTGKTILVRINDRGPFKKGRLIDLSHGAAEQLGVAKAGTFPVRVRRVNPPETEKTALRNGQAVPERLETPATLLAALRKKLGTGPMKVSNPPAPSPATAAPPRAGATYGNVPTPVAPAKPVPAPTAVASGKIWVQVAAFSNRQRADALAAQLGGRVESAGGTLWRVRTGPYASEAAARAALGPLSAKGYPDARIVR